MKRVPCQFTDSTGIPVFADERLPPDRLAVAGIVKKQRPGPSGTMIVEELQITSVALAGVTGRPPS